MHVTDAFEAAALIGDLQDHHCTEHWYVICIAEFHLSYNNSGCHAKANTNAKSTSSLPDCVAINFYPVS
jgi:hypothetical protein